LRNTKSPIAETAVRHIAALYAIEADVRGQSPDARVAARKKLSAPIIEALKPWFEKQLSLISSGSTLATDIRYALSHWAGLTRFLEDGRLGKREQGDRCIMLRTEEEGYRQPLSAGWRHDNPVVAIRGAYPYSACRRGHDR
jgi:hypothetical protein